MNGQRIGYIRVSTQDQNPSRQLENISVEKLFIETASAKDINRPQLQAALSYLREGDTLVVYSMDRLARDLSDLRHLVMTLTSRGVQVEFHKEKLVFCGDDSPMAMLLLSVMGAFAEFERSLLRERQKEGIELAKKKGLYRGRKPALTQSQIKDLHQQAEQGIRKSELAKLFNISRETVYQYLKKGDNQEESFDVTR